MNSKKCTIIWGASIICFAVFIISFLILILGSSSAASQNYGPGLSLIAGIIVAIIDIAEIVSQSKKAGKSLVPFVVSSFKDENGQDMKRLAWALFFSVSPIFILIAVLMLCSGKGDVSVDNSRNAVSGTTSKEKGNNNSQPSQPKSDDFHAINNIAGNSNNDDIQQIAEAKHNEIQKLARKNPGLSDDELAKLANVNVSTARAHRPNIEMSYQEINHIAGNTSNDIQQIAEAKHNEIQKLARKNPGLSDDELAKLANVNVSTARAHRPNIEMSYQEINHIAGNTSNDIQQIAEAKHNEIQKLARKNPGLSDEELAKQAKVNTSTARAHRPR